MIFGVVVCGLDLQNSRFPVWQLDKIIDVRQHIGILRMIEHLFNLIDTVAGFSMKYLSHQILQQMSHFLLHPVALRILIRNNLQLVIIKIAGRCKGRYSQNSGCIASANSTAAPFQPFLFRQVRRLHQNSWFVGTRFFRHITHLVSGLVWALQGGYIPFSTGTLQAF